MLPDTHATVVNELHRRAAIRAKMIARQENDQKEKKRGGKKDKKDVDKEEKEKDTDAGKWQTTHQQLAETRSLDNTFI